MTRAKFIFDKNTGFNQIQIGEQEESVIEFNVDKVQLISGSVIELDGGTVAYTPENPGDWSTVPGDLVQAVDYLAAGSGSLLPSAEVWTIEESPSPPSSTTDTVKLYALDVAGRTEPSIILSDGLVVPLVAVPVRSENMNFILSQRDEAVFVTANAITASLPIASVGRQYAIIKTHLGADAITIARVGSEQIQGAASDYVLPSSGDAAYGRWSLVCDGTNWWVF